MAINITQFNMPMTPQEARDFLQRQTDSFGVFFDVERCYELMAILQLENKHITKELRRVTNTPQLDLRKKQMVIDTLQKIGVNPVDFQNKRSRSSNDAFNADIQDKILKNINYSDSVRKFITQYQKY